MLSAVPLPETAFERLSTPGFEEIISVFFSVQHCSWTVTQEKASVRSRNAGNSILILTIHPLEIVCITASEYALKGFYTSIVKPL